MKLYIWQSVESLQNWSYGQCFALADSKEQAIELIAKSLLGNSPDKYDLQKAELLTKELTTTEPIVTDSPIGYCIEGSS